MKKIYLALITVFSITQVNAIDYEITFAGTTEPITVENVTKNESVTVNVDDIVTLSLATGVFEINNTDEGLNIYPNPSDGLSNVIITAPAPGDAIISVCDLTGKTIAQIKALLETTSHAFKISGLGSGLYLISVKGNSYQLSGKLLSNGTAVGSISVVDEGNVTIAVKEKPKNIKGIGTTFNMEIDTSDVIKFSSTSGVMSTTYAATKIRKDTLITFEFYPCTDIDDNNYPVTVIGDAVWMATTLKVTKFFNGSDITLAQDPAEWGGLGEAPAYGVYPDTSETYRTPATLYNWWAVYSYMLCPIGWHVSDTTDWQNMEIAAGLDTNNWSGYIAYQSYQLKERGILNWGESNTGNNAVGMNLLPTGLRYDGGSWSFNGERSYTWTIDMAPDDETAAIYYWSGGWINGGKGTKNYGMAVRCVMDPPIEDY